MTSRGNGELTVLEYGGTARSGKGTIVNHLSGIRDGIATEETGADYRAVTKRLLLDGKLEEGMLPDDIKFVLGKVGIGELTDFVATRNEMVETIGLPELYKPDVANLVGYVSPLPNVRSAVKAGFKKRVEAVRDNDNYGVLLIDGRNLAPVIDSIERTQLVMRTFVSCSASEAALRECMRRDISPNDDEWHDAYNTALESISNRNRLDAERSVDPVIPDEDAVDYWHDQSVLDISAQLHYLETDNTVEPNERLINWLMEKSHHSEQLRRGVGAVACRDNRQVHFDTGMFRGHYENPLEAMLVAAHAMFDEALGKDHLADIISQRIPLTQINYGRLGKLTDELLAAVSPLFDKKPTQ